MTYQKFYHRVGKDPQDMTKDELQEELEGCEEWEEECKRIGQGINSKETIRERNIRDELINRVIDRRLTVDEAFEIARA